MRKHLPQARSPLVDRNTCCLAVQSAVQIADARYARS
jgi:hypothetical protein